MSATNGAPTVQYPQPDSDTDSTAGVFKTLATSNTAVSNSAPVLVYIAELVAVYDLAITQPGSYLWTGYKVVCTTANQCVDSNEVKGLSEGNNLRFSERVTVQFTSNAITNTNPSQKSDNNVPLAFTFVSGDGSGTSLEATSGNLSPAVNFPYPEDSNTAPSNVYGRPILSGTGSDVMVAQAGGYTSLNGWTSPLWTTSTSAKFVVGGFASTGTPGTSDFGATGLARYVFQVTAPLAEDNGNKASLACLNSMTTTYGTLFGELELGGNGVEIANTIDLNVEYTVKAQECLDPVAVETPATSTRISFFGGASEVFDMEKTYQLNEFPTLRPVTEVAAPGLAGDANFAVWVDNSCLTPFICHFGDDAAITTAGVAAAACFGGTGCSRTPVCEFFGI